MNKVKDPPSVWWFAFGYFACYAPYSTLTKAVTKDGLWFDKGINGFELLPPSVMASLVGMLIFLTVMRWWKYATQRQVLGFTLPSPQPLTFVSGLSTAAIIGTTTLAYTFSGVSIVFMMLLMRGGVLIIAPVVDIFSGRKVRWFCVIALLLSLGALIVAFSENGATAITFIAAVDVTIYLASYFVRLRLMSLKAKSEDPNANKRFFVEEQMVATPAVLIFLAIAALIGQGEIMLAFRRGFTSFWTEGVAVPHVLLIGLLSQGTGLTGGLILLDKRENTFCVPVNRSSSILAGVVAQFLLTGFFGNPMPSAYQFSGAGLIIAALAFLSIPPLIEKKMAS
ncbi:MAG: hypothetical protein HN348_16480 [Proteobacteria bacterium]|nr:hypothetical protein [Pseudomonadota bacterium]